MPRIPDSSQLGYSAPQTRTPRFQDRSGQIVGDATQRLAGTIGQVAGALQEREDKFSYAQAKSTLLQADVEARKSLENDPDWSTYETRYSESMTKAREKAVGLIRGNRDRALFDMDAKLDVERGVGEVRGLARRKEVDTGRASLESTLAANRSAALSAPDEATRSSFHSASLDMIGGAVQKGYFTAEEGGAVGRRYSESYAEGFIDTQDLSRQIEVLRKPEGTPANFLAPDRRANLLKSALNEQRILRDRAEAEAKARQAELRVALGERVRDASAAYRMGLDFDDPPSQTDFMLALGPEDGKKAFAELQKDQALAVELNSISRLPPNEQRAALAKLEPGAQPQPQVETTKLSGAEEAKYRSWLQKIGQTPGSGYAIDDTWTGSDYDYRGFFQKFGPVDVKKGQHFTDEFKLPNHETFSKESKYATGKAADYAGTWNGETFVPAKAVASTGVAEQAERYNVIRQRADALNRAKLADPASYVATYSPSIQRAYDAYAESSDDPAAAQQYAQASIAEQARLGVANPQILPKAQAESIAQSFYMKPEEGEKLAALIQSERDKWGRYWPKVAGQLMQAKMPSAAIAIARGMDPGAATRLAGVSSVPMAEMKKGVDIPPADVAAKLEVNMSDFQRSLDGVVGAENTFSAMYDAAERLSYAYIRQGKNVSDATQQAYSEVLGAHYSFGEINDRTFRVPTGHDLDAIEDGARAALGKASNLKAPIALGSSSSEEAASDLQRVIAKRGYWVTSANGERGLALFLDGAPVLRSDGSVYELTWDELANVSEDRRQESLRKAQQNPSSPRLR
jgi:hypothetical protein